MSNIFQLPDNFTNCIEDAVMYLGGGTIGFVYEPISIQPYDHPIARSLATQLDSGLALTEKQGTIAERLLKKYSGALTNVGFDIEKLLAEKIYKNPFRVIDKTKSIYVDGEKLVCKSPFIPDLVNAFKKRKKVPYKRGDYQPDTKEWNFDYNEPNLDFMFKQIKGKNFSIDREILDKYEQIEAVLKDGIQYYPILKYNNKFYVENILLSDEEQNNLATINDVRTAVMWARKRGCVAYDDSIVELYGKQTYYDKIMLGDETQVNIDFRKYPVSDLINTISKTATTIIFVQSADPEQLKSWIKNLKDNGINENDIAVCFRYKKDKEANEFIKNENVNEYSPNKKVLITNERIPKTFVKDNVEADIIIVDLAIKPAHYKTQIYLENKPLVMYNTTLIKGIN